MPSKRKQMAKKVASETTADDDRVLITAHVDKALIAEIEEYRWTNRCEGKAEAIRQLIVKGYDSVNGLDPILPKAIVPYRR